MSKTFLNPSETTCAVINMGITRGGEKSSLKILVSGFAAGMFIALAGIGQLTAAQLFTSGAARFIGASVFPVGLMLCVFTGTSLFTGNSLLSLAYLTKNISLFQLIKNLMLVWIGNFLGSIFTAYITFYSGVFSSPLMEKTVVQAAFSKTVLPFSQGIFSGFLCNILVAIGVIMAMSATDAAGKIFACWFPIMLFVLSGYQHVVANMFVISMGKLISPETFSMGEIFINHFIPVTIGNFLSGGVFLPIVLYFLYVEKK